MCAAGGFDPSSSWTRAQVFNLFVERTADRGIEDREQGEEVHDMNCMIERMNEDIPRAAPSLRRFDCFSWQAGGGKSVGKQSCRKGNAHRTPHAGRGRVHPRSRAEFVARH